MEIRPISMTLSDNIKKAIELQKFYKEMFNKEAEKMGIPEAWGGAPLTNEEIDLIHRQFLIKYNLL